MTYWVLDGIEQFYVRNRIRHVGLQQVET